MKKIFTLAVATGLLIAAQNGFAGSAGPTPLDYRVTIAPACTIDAAGTGGMDFGIHDGTYDLTGVAAGAVSVACPIGRTFMILFDGGNNLGAGSQRRLSSGAGFINYFLMNDLNSTEVGDAGPYPAGVSYTMTYNHPGITATAAVDTSVPYLLVADVSATGAAPGTYTDQVRATVVW